MKLLKRLILKKLLRGNNVECPICGKKFIAFLPFGIPLRANAHCPHCGSLERHRLLWLYLKNETDFFLNPLRVLHVAPEKFFMIEFKKRSNIDYIAGDKFDGGYDHSYSKDVMYLDVTDIDFADNTFDVVFCSHVLEHVPDDIKAMKEIFRVIKPGGWAVLQVPMDETRVTTLEDPSISDPKERERLFGQFDHVRAYGLDYKDRLASVGFSVDVIDYYTTFNEDQQFRFGLMKDDIYRCSK